MAARDAEESFCSCVSAMESGDQTQGAISSMEPTCNWVDMVDKEGLCRVNNDTYLWSQLKSRQGNISSQMVLSRPQAKLSNDRLYPASWITRLNHLAGTSWLLQFLKDTRHFSFAKSWNDKTAQEKFKKHGTRKTLRAEHEDK